MSVESIIQQVLNREPDLGASDESRCLPGWIESFCRKWKSDEEITLSHAAVGSLLHTMIAARQRTRRLIQERDRFSRLLSLYDLCECGWERHHHAGCDTQGRAPGATAGCPDFRLYRPADPLETILEVSK